MEGSQISLCISIYAFIASFISVVFSEFDQNWRRHGLSFFISGVNDLAYRKRNA